MADPTAALQARLAQLTGKPFTTPHQSPMQVHSRLYERTLHGGGVQPTPTVAAAAPLAPTHDLQSFYSATVVPANTNDLASTRIANTYATPIVPASGVARVRPQSARSALAPAPRSATTGAADESDLLRRAATPSTSNSLVQLTRATVRSSSSKKKKLQRQVDQGHVRANSHGGATAWPATESTAIPALPANATKLAEGPSLLQSLTRDLVTETMDAEAADGPSTGRSASGSSAPASARDLLSSQTISKLQSIISTSWLSDSTLASRTEESLLSSRHYQTWRDAGDVASHDDFARLQVGFARGAHAAMAEWTNLLSECLFITVAPGVNLTPPAGSFGPGPAPAPSTTALKFGSRTLFVLLSPDPHGGLPRLQVRVGGGFVDAIEFARDYASIEGRKAAVMLDREELICLALLLQERLLTAVIKRHQQRQEQEQQVRALERDTRGVDALASQWRQFESRLCEQVLSARIKLAKQRLHWRWAREERVRSFEHEVDARAALHSEEAAAEEAVRREDAMAAQHAVSSGATNEGPILSLAGAIDRSPLPLHLASFMDALGSNIANLSDSHAALSAKLIAANESLAATRAREAAALENVAEVSRQLQVKERVLRDAHSAASDLQARLTASESRAAELEASHRSQSDAWSKKLATLLDELRSKSSQEAADRQQLEQDHAEEVDDLRRECESTKHQLEMMEARAEDDRTKHERTMQNAVNKLADAETEHTALRTALERTRDELRESRSALEQHERDARLRADVEEEATRLRAQVHELESRSRQDQQERRDERARFKHELVAAMRAAPTAGVRTEPAGAALGSPSKSPSSSPRLDTTFDLTIDDIITELPSQHRGADASTSSSTGAFVPMSLFSRLRQKYGNLASQHEVLTRVQQSCEARLQQADERGFETERTLAATEQQLADAARHVEQLQAELESASRARSDAESGHAASLADFTTASEAKIDEINAIYAQMFAIKEHALSEVNAERAQLEEQLAQTRQMVNDVVHEGATARDNLQASFGAFQSQRDSLEREVMQARRSRDALAPMLRQAAAELQHVKQAHQDLRLQFERLSTSTINVESVRATLTVEFTKHTQLLEEYMRRYKQELSLRRRYFDQVQELNGNIRVFVRIRPTLAEISATAAVDTEEEITGDPLAQVVFTNPTDDPCALSLSYAPVGSHAPPSLLPFSFDRVFSPADSQDTVFKHVESLVTSFMDGFNVTIASYGQTGSGSELARNIRTGTQASMPPSLTCCSLFGIMSVFLSKTHTVYGPESDPGLTFRVLRELFRIRDERSHAVAYSVSISMMEIYNESIRDLFVTSTSGPPKEHKLQDNGGNVQVVPPLTDLPCADEQSILNAVALGQRQRATSATQSNESSSRSHSVVVLRISGRDRHSAKTFTSRLQLLDLAGSERLKRSNSVGDRLRETRAVNSSLSVLGTVLQGLQRGDAHIPYRNSTLTHLLKPSLGGPGKTLLIVTVTPDARDISETYCSLQFGTRARKVELVTSPNSGTTLPANGVSPRKRRNSSVGSRAAVLAAFPDGLEGLDEETAAYLTGSTTIGRFHSPSSDIVSPSGGAASAKAATAAMAQKLQVSESSARQLQSQLDASLAREETLMKKLAQHKKAASSTMAPSNQANGDDAKSHFSFDSPASTPSRGRRIASSSSSLHSPARSTPSTPHRESSLRRISTGGSGITTPRAHGRERLTGDELPVKSTLAGGSVADVSHLTAVIAGLKLELHQKARLEEDLRTERARHADKEAAFAARQLRWKEAEERRKTTEAIATKRSQTRDDAPILDPNTDVHHPESVTITRLTGDVHQLRHELRTHAKRQAVVEKFLADQQLPTIDQLWSDRNKSAAARQCHHHSKSDCERLHPNIAHGHAAAAATPRAYASPMRTGVVDSALSSTLTSAVSSPAPLARTILLEVASPIEEVAPLNSTTPTSSPSIVSTVESAHTLTPVRVRSRSEERGQTSAQSTPRAPRETTNGSDSPLVQHRSTPTRVRSLSSPPKARDESKVASADSLQSPPHREPDESTDTPTRRVGYVPHRQLPVFKSLIPSPEPLARRPRVPVLSKSFPAGPTEEQRQAEEKRMLAELTRPRRTTATAITPSPVRVRSTPTKPPVPKQTRIPRAAKPLNPAAATALVTVQTEPIILRRKSAPPTPRETEEATSAPPLTIDVPPSATSPTHATIALGLELSAQILAAEAERTVEATPEIFSPSSPPPPPPPPIVSNSSNPVDPDAVPRLRGGGKKKQTATSPIDETPSPLPPADLPPVAAPVQSPHASPVAKPSPSPSPFAGISFSQLAAEASAAVYSASPSAAPFRTTASHAVGIAATVAQTSTETPSRASVPPRPASSPVKQLLSPSAVASSGSPQFVGEPLVAAALAELKEAASSTADSALDHVILLVLPAQTSELSALGAPCATEKKVVVYAKGRGAFTPKWEAMFLEEDMAYHIILTIRQPDVSSVVAPRFVCVEWIGGDTEMGHVMDLQEFSPILHGFLSRHLPISLYSQASHVSQVTHAAICDDLGASSGSRTRSRNNSTDSDASTGSFVDLRAQFEAEQQRVVDARAQQNDESGGDASPLSPVDELAAFLSEQAHDVDESDIVSPEEVEAELRARSLSNRASSIPRTSFAQTMPLPVKSVLKSAATSRSASPSKKNVSFAHHHDSP